MQEGDTLVKIFEREHEERIAGFGIPYWLTCYCPGCKLPLGIGSIMSFSVRFEPMFVGDISFDYFCKSCSVSFSRHLKCDIKHISEIAKLFSLDNPPAQIVNVNDLLSNFMEHNVVKKLAKEAGKSNG